MALWQYTFHIIPNKKGIKDIPIKDGLLDDEALWNEKSIELQFFDEIENIMSRNKSWADWIILFGEQDSNRFEVFHENNKVNGVSFRIDFTSDYNEIIEEIVDFCLKKNLLILDTELLPVTMSFMSLKTKIINSRNKNNLDRLNSGSAPDIDFLKNKDSID